MQSCKESAMYQWMVSKRQRDVHHAGQSGQDVRAWLLIGAIALGTLLVVWVPLIISALHQ
jgi:hypothetical protein